jgi:hypothetical protein
MTKQGDPLVLVCREIHLEIDVVPSAFILEVARWKEICHGDRWTWQSPITGLFHEAPLSEDQYNLAYQCVVARDKKPWNVWAQQKKTMWAKEGR